ncbi:DUF397 domain-containing protein [Streptomyces sp. NPDC056835]|uniref:DUF397 domain-containing protein n=1 Tax=Streptomyces sp. NPDC056835 TaxID=3345956 RepID=UPI00368169BE
MTVTADALTGAGWYKSSYSDGHGGNCVESARVNADWFKSSYSNDTPGGDCVEGARLADGAMALRDSKDPHSPAFVFGGGAWAAFVDALNGGQL